MLLRREIPDLSWIIPAANDLRHTQLVEILRDFPELPVALVEGRSREVMAAADAVLLASGTATLEALLLKRPMVIAYRMAALSWALISRMTTTAFAGLPNVLAGRELVPELLQDDATAARMFDACLPLLRDEEQRESTLLEFDTIHRQLRLDFGSRAALAIADLLEQES